MEEAEEEEEEEEAAAAAKQFAKLEAVVVVDMTEKELVYRALLGDLLSPTQKAKLGAGDTAAAEEV